MSGADALSYARPDLLVSTSWLAEHLDDPEVRVLDVTAKLTSKLANRAHEDCYLGGHIPGSRFFDAASAHGELSDPDAALPWTWASAERFAEVMARHGIDRDTRVVLVARTPRPGVDRGTMWCTRAWWTMAHFGVDAAILWGGIEQWEAEGRPLETGPGPGAPPPAAAFEVASGWERGRASKDDVLAAIADDGGAACVVDSLSRGSFDGTEAGYGARKGHIEGAVNLPSTDLIEGETARFADPATLRERLDELGLLDRPRVITYCGGAIAATVDAFALALFGHDGVSVYDGSLMEWAADESLPMVDPQA